MSLIGSEVRETKSLALHRFDLGGYCRSGTEDCGDGKNRQPEEAGANYENRLQEDRGEVHSVFSGSVRIGH